MLRAHVQSAWASPSLAYLVGFAAAAGELRALLVGLALPTEAGEPALDGDGLGFWMRELDADKSRGIDADEFYVALSRWEDALPCHVHCAPFEQK